MKPLYWIVLAIVGALVYLRTRKPAPYVAPVAPPTLGPPGVSTDPLNPVFQIVNSQGAGGAQYDTDLSHYKLADQIHFSGWYRSTVDGSWYNPSTGEFFSAGSSPVSSYNPYADPAWLARQVQIDPTATFNPAGTDDPNSPNNPSNGYIIF